jgi:hypothetical protein
MRLGGEGASRRRKRERERERERGGGRRDREQKTRRWKKFEKKAEVRDPRQLVLFCLVPSRDEMKKKKKEKRKKTRK